MKIGIITLFVYSNYGNRLQNYAVQEILKELGYNAETLYFNKIKPKNAKEEILKKFTDENIKTRFIPNLEEVENEYDYFLIGSDQVFNPMIRATRQLNLIKRLKRIDNKKLVAFSASFGVDSLSTLFETKYAEHLNKYKRISVREIKAIEIIKNISGKKAQLLLDPTLIVNPNVWYKLASTSNFKYPNKYIFGYFLNNKNQKHINILKKAAKKQGIIHILNKGFQVEKLLKCYMNSEKIITTSYHGLILSKIFKKDYYLIGNAYPKVKSRFETLLNYKYDDFEKFITKERRRAHNFLKSSLK